MSDTPLILGFTDYRAATEKLAQALNAPLDWIDLHHFPDGESRLTLPARLPEKVIICRSLDQPNAKLVELQLAASTARRLGARHLTLVAPYLCYMRQDTDFHPGECISQRIIGDWLASQFDRLITVDPHLHRTPELALAVPVNDAVALSATGPVGRYIREHFPDSVLIGPDEESEQWVAHAAAVANHPFGVARKERHGDHEVRIQLPETEVHDRVAVLVDDIASTGHTLANTARALRKQGATRVHAIVTHALFVDNAIELMQAAGIDQIISSDAVPHPTNRIALADLLAAALRT